MPLGFKLATTRGECLECLKNQCLHIFAIAIDLILFKLADKEEMHNILVIFLPD